MSIENAIINDPNITVGTPNNKLKSIHTDSIDIDGFSIFREKNGFYKKDIKTNNITKLDKNSSRTHRWYKLKEYDNYVYLNGDLILDNSNIYLNGIIRDKININNFENKIDNTEIDIIDLSSTIINDVFNDRNIDTNGIVINSAWKKIETDTFFCSKNLVINGNLFVKKTPNNIDLNSYIEELSDRDYSYDSIIDGYTEWKTLDDLSTYTDKKIFIAGNILISCNLIITNEDYNNEQNYNIEEPYKSSVIKEIGIKDNLKITENDIILNNNKINLIGTDEIKLVGSLVTIDGDINFENSLRIGENSIYNDKSSLIIYKRNENEGVNVVEFWDSIENQDEDNGRGVIIGKSGITLIGVNENNNIVPENSAQIHIMSDVSTQNRMEVSGNYYRNTIINNNGNLLVANNNNFSNRINTNNLIIPEYSLDVNGHTFINGSLMIKHNNIIKAFFSVDNNILDNTTSNVMTCYFSWGISREDSSNIYKPINLDIDYYITSTNTNPINYKQQKYSILINPRNNEELNMPNLISAFPRDGPSMAIYRKTTVYSERLDYNSIILTFNTPFATFDHEQPFSSIAYANITVTGDNIFKQFYISNKLDFYGILDIENIEPINLVVRPGTHKINIYEKYNIEEYDRASFEISNLDPILNSHVYFDEMFLYIKSTDTTQSYDFDIKILNRLKEQVGDPLQIHCDEISLITINPMQLSCNLGYVINDFRLNLYNFYEISTIYDWDILKDYMFFESSNNINVDQNTSELIINGSLSGQYCNIEIDIALLNNEETNRIKVGNSKLFIIYEEPHKIEIINNINEINFDSLEYDEISNNKLINLNNYNETTIALDNQIYIISDLEESLEIEYSNIKYNIYNIIDIDNTLDNYSNFINNKVQENNTDIIRLILIDRYNYNSNYNYNIELYSNLELNTRLNINLLNFYSNNNQELIRFTQSDIINENIINLSIDHINTSIQIEAYYMNNYNTTSNTDLILNIVNY
jgi:hypothetical protein